MEIELEKAVKALMLDYVAEVLWISSGEQILLDEYISKHSCNINVICNLITKKTLENFNTITSWGTSP